MKLKPCLFFPYLFLSAVVLMYIQQPVCFMYHMVLYAHAGDSYFFTGGSIFYIYYRHSDGRLYIYLYGTRIGLFDIHRISSDYIWLYYCFKLKEFLSSYSLQVSEAYFTFTSEFHEKDVQAKYHPFTTQLLNYFASLHNILISKSNHSLVNCKLSSGETWPDGPTSSFDFTLTNYTFCPRL